MTTDWTAQTQAGIDRWWEAQRAWWTQVLGAGGDAPGAGAGALSAQAAREAIDVWRTSAYRVVDAQAQGLLAVLGERTEPDVQGLVRRWTDAQREMWQGWLAMAEGVAPKEQQASPGLEQAGREMVESLREAAEHLVRSQAEWAKTWTEAAAHGATSQPSQDSPDRGTGGPEAAPGGP